MSGDHHQQHGSLTARAATASAAMAVLLLLLKGWASWMTGSVAMLGSLADTLFDVIAALVTLYAVRLSAAPADDDHRFGHGKAEALAALAQVGLIVVAASAIFWHALARLRGGAATENAALGIGVSVVAIVLTMALIAYQRRVIARTGSVAIRTDSLHYQSDLLFNLSVIAALALDQYLQVPGADALFGIGIAGWLLWNAWAASRQAIDQLMDREWPEDKRQRFVAVANAQPEFRGIHDLRTRTSGSHDFVQFHVWVDADMTIARAHDVMEAAEDRLHAAFPGTEVLIHLDPEGKVDRAGHHDERLRETPER